jgi:hypothetical protein
VCIHYATLAELGRWVVLAFFTIMHYGQLSWAVLLGIFYNDTLRLTQLVAALQVLASGLYCIHCAYCPACTMYIVYIVFSVYIVQYVQGWQTLCSVGCTLALVYIYTASAERDVGTYLNLWNVQNLSELCRNFFLFLHVKKNIGENNLLQTGLSE